MLISILIVLFINISVVQSFQSIKNNQIYKITNKRRNIELFDTNNIFIDAVSALQDKVLSFRPTNTENNVLDNIILYFNKKLTNSIDSFTSIYHVKLDQESILNYFTTNHDIFNIEYNYIELIGLFLSFLVVSIIFTPDENSIDGEPYGYNNFKYNPIEAKKYYQKRPLVVFLRSIEIATKSSKFGLQLLYDYLNNQLIDPIIESQRAEELCQLLNELGPTFIKVGQSLSIRTDLLRPLYIKSLTQLQDRVPSFSTQISREIIQNELSINVDDVFVSGLDSKANVVAAASLGQVFKAKLIDGSYVAVKVQRPDIIKSVSLDMHILRSISPYIKTIFRLESDLVGIVDDWGKGFVGELDYLAEAKNSQIFMKSIESTPLNDTVFAPEVVTALTTRKVLTTQWIDGDRLELSNQKDISILCALAMNTYLTMLLSLPLLHCDPHPGNLKRTPDGKLCILDWGLVTHIDSEIQTTLISHVSHLVSKDYAKIPNDLVKLGFVSKGKEEFMAGTDVVEVLTDIYGRWALGGGATRIDINAVFTQINGLADRYGRLLQIPPYFAYIVRAFAVLEGIGLSYDPDYSILNECLPYIAQRLLTDPSANTEESLKSFIFGAEIDSERRIINSDRLELLIKGVNNYTKSSKGLINKSTKGSNTNQSRELLERITSLSNQIFDLLFPSTTIVITPLQRIVIEELSKIIISNSKYTFTQLRNLSGNLPNGRSVLGTLIDPIGLFSDSNLIALDEHDNDIIESSNRLYNILVSNFPIQLDLLNQLELSDIQLIIQQLINKIITNRSQITIVVTLLISELLKQLAVRAETPNKRKPKQQIDSTLDLENELTKEPSARVTRARALLANAKREAINF